MGCFYDLPTDVVWLIFRKVIRDFFEMRKVSMVSMRYYEAPCKFPTKFDSAFVPVVCDLATLNSKCLRVVKSKCKRLTFGRMIGWLFVAKAIT